MARPATAAVRLLTGEREPVRLATTGPIWVEAGGLLTIDGVVTEVGDRILVKDQDDGTQNGIYTASEGEWFRAADARTSRTLQKGTTVRTQLGTVNASRMFIFSTDEPVIGTDDIAVTFDASDHSSYVTLTGPQTLTDKTLTSPAVNGGTIASATLTLKQSAAPTPTAEGDTQWDTDDNVLAIGDGAATKLFVPIPASTAAGDIEYFTGAKVKARLAKGTASQALLMNAGATAPAWATLPFTASYDSGQQAITAAGSLTLAHGLGAKPKLCTVVLQCLTAEHGYSIGDEAMCAQTRQTAGGGGDRGVSLVPDAANLNIRFAASATAFNLLHKTTGAAVEVTNANWALVARAWA